MNFMIVNKEELFMFNLDEYMLHQVLAIVGIVFLIFFIVGYIITAIFSKIMFDILGVRSGLAFIPFYNTYRIYKEYKGRVWKRNWGVAYLLTFTLPSVAIGALLLLLINLGFTTDAFSGQYAGILFTGIALLVVSGLIAYIFNFIMLFIMYLPIFDTKGRRVVLYIQAALTILSSFSGAIFQGASDSILSSIFSLAELIFPVVFMVVYFVAATDIRARIRSGEYVLQEKLDYRFLNSYEINSILKSRGRRLVVPNMNNSFSDYPKNNNEEVNRIEYI
jgi:putative membrane protein